METFKKVIKHLLYPHPIILILLIFASAASLLLAFLVFGSAHYVSYACYALSAYTLTAVCFKTPRLIKLFKDLKQNNRMVNRLTTDDHLKVKISLYSSLAINTAYAIFQFGLGIIHGSFWFHSLAAYYLLLVIMRFFLARDVRGIKPGEDMDSEYRRYRFCGVILMIMNLALTSIVFFITYFGRGFVHHEITTIAMAAFTFTSFSIAIINIVKYRKYNSPVYSAAKVINLAAATVSMLTLETAMFSAFGSDTDAELKNLMTLLTGIAISLFILTIAVYMIIHATQELKKLKGHK